MASNKITELLAASSLKLGDGILIVQNGEVKLASAQQFFLFVNASANLTPVSSITKSGVTFTFAEPALAGEYANGDPWVVGPVTITSISPEAGVIDGNFSDGGTFTGRTINGAVLNPGNRTYAPGGTVENNHTAPGQGFDSRGQSAGSSLGYDSAQNVDPGVTGQPLTVAEGSVVKAISIPSPLASDDTPRISDLVVLTVVTSQPAADAIRPGVSRTSKSSNFRLSDFDLSRLNNFTPPANAPTPAAALEMVNQYFQTFTPDSINARNVHPSNNHDSYGREIADEQINPAMLGLHLNWSDAEKRAVLAHLGALAEDVWARAEEGGHVLNVGGGNQWKKAPLVMVAAALGAKAPAGMLEYADAALHPKAFAEDSHIYRVNDNHVLNPRRTDDGRPRTAFENWMIDAVDWGEEPLNPPYRAPGSNWDTLYYRDIFGSAAIGNVLAAVLTTGGRDIWNNADALGYYLDAYYDREIGDAADGANQINLFPAAMLNAHRPAAAVPAFASGNVRQDKLRLVFDTQLDFESVPAPADFTVTVNGSSVAVTSVLGLHRTNVGLNLASAVSDGDVVTVAYTPGANPVRNVDGVNAPAFSGASISVGSPPPPPSLITAGDYQLIGPATHAEVLDVNTIRAIRDGTAYGRLRVDPAALPPSTYTIQGEIVPYDGAQPAPEGIDLNITDGYSAIPGGRIQTAGPFSLTHTFSSLVEFQVPGVPRGWRINRLSIFLP